MTDFFVDPSLALVPVPDYELAFDVKTNVEVWYYCHIALYTLYQYAPDAPYECTLLNTLLMHRSDTSLIPK